jgi:hypothetical protein
MQSTGFAKFTAAIVRKDWKQHAKPLLGLVGGMIVIILAMMRLAPDVAFGKAVLAGVGLVVPYGLAQICFFIERQYGLLRIIPPATPFQLVLAKFASAFSMVLFIVNIPGLLIGDPVFLFRLDIGVLLMTSVCMAIVVISDQTWASLIPLWILFLPYLYARPLIDGILGWAASHDVALAVAGLCVIPLIVLWSALNFKMKPAGPPGE